MILNKMFKKTSVHSSGEQNEGKEPSVPEGILKRCNACKAAIFTEDVKKNNYICPECGNYFRMHWKYRIPLVSDEGSFEEWDRELTTSPSLEQKAYQKKLQAARELTGLEEAVVTGKAQIKGIPVALAVMDSRFIMASMGQIVGEKITRLVERAGIEKLPVIAFVCSGGARMQEGIISLMQMAKTSAAIKRYRDQGGLYIPVLTNPTTGGITASFAMEGDIILAEPGALIGFAGPRVIEQTIGQKLPRGFQSSEFVQDHGFIDAIVTRDKMKETLYQILRLHGIKETVNVQEVEKTPDKNQPCKMAEGNSISPWERVQKSRDKNRPVGSDYIQGLFTDFLELHGDRCFGDDPAVIGGIAYFHGRPVTVIAQEKGKNTKDNVYRNFGMVSPEGYRKALRLMKQAEKFGRPVIFFVDTPGAFCGMEAEERGQGEAIANMIYQSSGLKVPVLSVIIGEGGSGGALAMATADEVWMMENSIYSILSPEGFASILWKDSKKAKEAAMIMKLTAKDLFEQGVIEKVIHEPEVYDRENMETVLCVISVEIHKFLEQYGSMDEMELLDNRYHRFRSM